MKVSSDMEFIGFSKIPRLFRPVVITEKIDGTNGQVLIVPTIEMTAEHTEHRYVGAALNGNTFALYAGSRSRFISPYCDHYGFAGWVWEHANELVKLGPGLHFGEWWGQGINRGYGLKEKRFSLFNVTKWGDSTVRPACCHVVPVVGESEVFSDLAVEVALERLRYEGSLAVPGYAKPEGVVVYHKAGNLLFKVTLENDSEPKTMDRKSVYTETR